MLLLPLSNGLGQLRSRFISPLPSPRRTPPYQLMVEARPLSGKDTQIDKWQSQRTDVWSVYFPSVARGSEGDGDKERWRRREALAVTAAALEVALIVVGWSWKHWSWGGGHIGSEWRRMVIQQAPRYFF